MSFLSLHDNDHRCCIVCESHIGGAVYIEISANTSLSVSETTNDHSIRLDRKQQDQSSQNMC